MQALGHTLIVIEDKAEQSYKLDNDTLLVKPDVFQVHNRNAKVISVGKLVREDLKPDDRVYLRSQATIGNELVVDGLTYSVVDEAEILVKF